MSVIHDLLHRLLDARPISDLERDLFHRKLDEHAAAEKPAAPAAPVDAAQGA
ncbi:MAG: hypothetical protein M0030_04575 [Actinomycetota bacterium]|nr:hypothetical protein [Actinomycetota bacterium]